MDQLQKSLCQSKILDFSEVVHNCLDMAVTSLFHHCKYFTKFILLLRKSAVGS